MSDLSLSLSELNGQVRNAINSFLPDSYWVRAETSDVRRNQNGHCYLEFIEKDVRTQNIVARARGVIWSNTFMLLSSYFEQQTGQSFTSGLSVLVRVSVEFHELYGYSLSVVDIDPSFTLGEIARNRLLILKQLEADGVLDLNKELPMAELVNRISVISSPTAAGYEDFSNQLMNNSYGFSFYVKLFPAIMQGDRTESSVIAALDRIYEYHDSFDAVVIIRGGGASSDLSGFDSYEIASNCAQFPLPIISGIGHERDFTVIDEVAHTRVKTPTAAAEFLIGRIGASAAQLAELQQSLISLSGAMVEREQKHIYDLSRTLVHSSKSFSKDELSEIEHHQFLLRHYVKQIISDERHYLASKEQYNEMVSPDNILKRGYTLTLKDGKIIKSPEGLKADDKIKTIFRDGEIESIIQG